MNENEELLLKYLCMALPHGICANLPNHHLVSHKYVIHDINIQNGWTTGLLDCAGRIQIYSAKVEDIKPYLRPMSSMAKEEKEELLNLLFDKDAKYFYIDEKGLIDSKMSDLMEEELICPSLCPINMVAYTNWLLKNHFDFIGLIPKGLAIEVSKENNPYKN